MSTSSTVAVVGSGPVGTAIAHYCASRNIDVTVFEKGPPTDPFPFVDAFMRAQMGVVESSLLPDNLMGLEQTGDYKRKLDDERVIVVGGAGTVWAAQTPRPASSDLITRSKYRYGTDWPITYSELEPYLCKAEAFLGVSGTDEDNPFAPPRSLPFPLPPFKLGFYEQLLADRAKAKGIVIHSTPQARTRMAYQGRNGCLNYGVCDTCPTGARYAPNFHLQQAVASKHCTIRSGTSVRRIIVERGRVKGLVIRTSEGSRDEEHGASIVVVAGGTLESTRLLLLSSEGGLGNAGGQLGRHFQLKHIYNAHLHFKEKIFPQRLPFGAQSQQFVEPQTRGKHGGVRLNLSSTDSLHEYATFGGVPEATVVARELSGSGAQPPQRVHADNMLEAIRLRPHCMRASLLCESIPAADNRLELSAKTDRFGDRFLKAHVEDSEFDHETYRYVVGVVERLATALGASIDKLSPGDAWFTGHHHYGGTRMGKTVADGVVDPLGEVHGVSNLFVLGGSTFVAQSCNNPTLTMVALALRSAELIAERTKAPR